MGPCARRAVSVCQELLVRALLRAVAIPERATVVACLRGDFYAHTAAYPELAAPLSANHVTA